MAFKNVFDNLWQIKGDKEIAVNIRSQGEYVYREIVELITTIQGNADIDIDLEIRGDFVDLLNALKSCRTTLQDFAASHPEFMEWKPPV